MANGKKRRPRDGAFSCALVGEKGKREKGVRNLFRPVRGPGVFGRKRFLTPFSPFFPFFSRDLRWISLAKSPVCGIMVGSSRLRDRETAEKNGRLDDLYR
jgi:hypothetical protein